LEFSLSLLATAQRGGAIMLPYFCNSCKKEGNAMLTPEEIAELNVLSKQQLQKSAIPASTRLSVGPETASAPAPKKRGRPVVARELPQQLPATTATNTPATGTTGVLVTPPPAATQVDLGTVTIVQKVINGAAKEVDTAPLVKLLREQVTQWEKSKLIKEYESCTGDVYKQGVTTDDAMIRSMVSRLAGVPLEAVQ
jgi:hypothetical protein